MGYYRTYSLHLADAAQAVPVEWGWPNETVTRIVKEFRDAYPQAAYALDKDGWTALDTCRWSWMEEELLEFSVRYPSVLFTMDVRGESGERWKLYVLNGKSQRAEYTCPPFDPTLLTDPAASAASLPL